MFDHFFMLCQWRFRTWACLITAKQSTMYIWRCTFRSAMISSPTCNQDVFILSFHSIEPHLNRPVRRSPSIYPIMCVCIEIPAFWVEVSQNGYRISVLCNRAARKILLVNSRRPNYVRCKSSGLLFAHAQLETFMPTNRRPLYMASQ